jgi:WXXGXW repeat (2 copies)
MVLMFVSFKFRLGRILVSLIPLRSKKKTAEGNRSRQIPRVGHLCARTSIGGKRLISTNGSAASSNGDPVRVWHKSKFVHRKTRLLFIPQKSEAGIHPSTPLPDLITETPGPPPPGHIYVWIPGHWRWKHSQYIWVPGHYQRPPVPTARWIPGDWVQHRRGWFWIEGHWSD